MTTFAQISTYVMTQFVLYERNKLPYWSILFLAGFLLIAKVDSGKGFIPTHLILPWLVMFIVMINAHLIICPFFAPDDEVRRLWQFPLRIGVILTAKHIAAAMILSAYVAVSFTAAMLMFPISVASAADAIIYFASTLVSLSILGDLPLWPINIYRGSVFGMTVLFTLAVGASSLPFIAFHALPLHGIICCVWIVLSIFVWHARILPRSAGWIIEMKFKRDDL
jgi:hypothetical protein